MVGGSTPPVATSNKMKIENFINILNICDFIVINNLKYKLDSITPNYSFHFILNDPLSRSFDYPEDNVIITKNDIESGILECENKILNIKGRIFQFLKLENIKLE